MARSCGFWIGDEFEAELFGTPGELADDSFAVAFLKVVLALVGIFLALGQQGVDQPGVNWGLTRMALWASMMIWCLASTAATPVNP